VDEVLGTRSLSASLSQPAVGASSTQANQAHPFPDAVAMTAGSLASIGGTPGVVAVLTGTLVGMAVTHGVQAAEHAIGSHLHSGQHQQSASSPAGTQIGVSSPSVAELPSAQFMMGQGEHAGNIPRFQETVTMGNTTYQIVQQSTGLQLS
jgi:hypothetical protein